MNTSSECAPDAPLSDHYKDTISRIAKLTAAYKALDIVSRERPIIRTVLDAICGEIIDVPAALPRPAGEEEDPAVRAWFLTEYSRQLIELEATLRATIAQRVAPVDSARMH